MYDTGDTWQDHYRGFELRINGQGDVWWQVYNGTDRLYVEPFPDQLVEDFLALKPLGGRVRVTEGGDVITRREDEDAEGARGGRTLDDYTSVYVGELDLTGSLVPADDPEYEVPLDPKDLSTGDLWPSVYDGARYSFGASGDVWWNNPETSKRHPVVEGIPESAVNRLQQLKPQGGSFRVTPSGDVITLVRAPATQTVRDQFGDLPVVVRNIIKLRRDRADLQMLPLFVETVGRSNIEVEEPRSLTDALSTEEREELEGWAASLGSTSRTQGGAHRASQGDSNDDTSPDAESPSAKSEDDEESPSPPTDDPVAWLQEDMEATEERINDR